MIASKIVQNNVWESLFWLIDIRLRVAVARHVSVLGPPWRDTLARGYHAP